MTIIRPNKGNKRMYNFLIVSLGLFVVIFIISGIAIYGVLVGLRHDINLLQKDFQEEELARTKLQNQIYKITDVTNLESKALQLGLIKEHNPQYLNISSVSDLKITEKTP